ncbi:protein phosphatase 1 regulatory subunit 12B isoform X3 [Hermetia illucens]|uniref:protein phosphatase 1 regulatory subunit 12B isoform X3 n=1 Tax=Hermetia illucens TaxID=343691 RepID=UPI0018CC1964|nr:protein phosphatase 1 regulatory subunit 12B isoform X3 [Hermetia illucens]
MNFDTRNNSALMKRAEQLRRWEESDTNREPTVPKNERGRKIKFSLGCVFLAACIAGDKDEVVRLLESGADINTANVDGLTALHQACIDDNLEMVEFLVSHGADINRQDNEGWTPLHATASCGFVSIARYLIENGADLTAINSDGELAIDLASTNSMADHLQTIYDENGIDCDHARQSEEQIMLSDAKKWLRSDASEADKPHPKTGATALHVAAAKGYTKVLSLLLAGRANVDKQDNDGWTPMHAAAHWGQKEAIQMLVDAMADIDIKNYAGQTPIDVAEPSIVKFLEEIKATNKRIKRRPTSQIRISDTIENHIEAPAKMIRVEVKSDSKDTVNDDNTDGLARIVENEESDSDITDSTESSHSTSISDNLEDKSKTTSESVAPTPADNNTGVEEDAPWRRSSSLRSRTQIENPTKTQVPEKDAKSTDSEVILRRTQSFENDEKFYQKYHELRARIKANSCPILPATQQTGVLGAVNPPNNYSVQRKTTVSLPVSPSTPNTTPPNTGQVRSLDNEVENENGKAETASNGKSKSNDSGSFRSKMSPGALFKNFFKSFVPPVRDEESETQRKAHAKRVRETRRSTQGVTLDEIKSAEELVKKKNLNNNNNNPNNEVPNTITTETPSITHTTTTTPTVNVTLNDRVPSTTSASFDDNSVLVGFKPIDPAPSGATSNSAEEEISATFTMTVPTSSSTKDRERITDSAASEELTSDSNVSYTLPPSQHPATSTIGSDPSNSADLDFTNDDKSRSDDGGDNDRDDVFTDVSATLNVPLSSNCAYKKTDTDANAEDVIRTASPTILTVDSRSASESERAKPHLSSPLEEEVTLRTPRDAKDKRSLFDIDNANSLTLAEKLRNEANKYNESVSQSNTDIMSVGLTTRPTVTGTDEIADERSGRRPESMPSSPLHMNAAERRPSWRLKFDSGNKFKLEDASTGSPIASNNSTIITSAPAVIAAANLSSSVTQRRTNNNTATPNIQPQRPVSAPVISTTSGNDQSNDRTKETPNEVTLSLRRNRNTEDKENDKENDSRSAQATQAVIQRRRRPKRRSTGVVHLDMDDNDPDRQDSPAENDEKESGSERLSRSRVGSSGSLSGEQNDSKSNTDATENGEVIDYKALWEAVKLENEQLKQELKKKDEELSTAKAAVDRFANATTKNSLSELEKRERRAMERKLSEMEEELKLLQKYKTENERLRAENRALTRVVSKLTNSAQNQQQNKK